MGENVTAADTENGNRCPFCDAVVPTDQAGCPMCGATWAEIQHRRQVQEATGERPRPSPSKDPRLTMKESGGQVPEGTFRRPGQAGVSSRPTSARPPTPPGQGEDPGELTEVTEEWDTWGVRGDTPGAHLRDMYGVEVHAEFGGDYTIVGYGEADSRGVARARAWNEILNGEAE